MADLTVQDIVEAGLETTFVAAAGGGDAIPDDGDQRTFLWIKNGGGSDMTVTVTAQSTSKTVDGYGTMTKSNAAVVVTAGEDRLIGPFPSVAFKDSAGKVQLTYSAVTSVTVAAVRLKKV